MMSLTDNCSVFQDLCQRCPNSDKIILGSESYPELDSPESDSYTGTI